MKQKYMITVADMELSILSDASADEVENIVGILDRRMREINQKSPRCTKNEAAVLCALSYCSERLAMQEAYKKMEKDAFRLAADNEKQKKTIEKMQEELDELRNDAAVMRSLLDRAVANAPDGTQIPAEKPKYVPKPFTKKEAAPEQISAFDGNPEDAAKDTAELDAAIRAQKSGGKKRGNMFDLLTFNDI